MIQFVKNKETFDLINPFQQKGKWFKCNLHTHTTTSDGDSSLEQRVKQYREKGYSILAVTDHEKTNDVSPFCDKDFLVLSGMETHPICSDQNDLFHFVCLNVPHGFSIPDDMDANSRIKLVKRAGGEVIFAHPYWCGQNVNHLFSVKGYIGIEVYNATCTKIGKAYSSVQWDDMLDNGRFLPAVASDDVHTGRDIFMGWTMIKAKDLSVKSIMNALRTGCFYASCGPIIEDFTMSRGKISLRCSPVVEIHFVSQRYFGQSFYSDDAQELTAATYTPNKNAKYVRAEVVDRHGRHAWTNPIILNKS